jgi:predicted NBD/HSP70 family sugar kinase
MKKEIDMLQTSIKINQSIDPQFIPMSLKNKTWNELLKNKRDKIEIHLGIMDNFENFNALHRFIFPEESKYLFDNSLFVEKLIKSMLWIYGGIKVYLDIPTRIFKEMSSLFSIKGKYAFDINFMKKVYEMEFELIHIKVTDFPKIKSQKKIVESNLRGNIIGFDAGGSDRKVSAIKNGNVIFSDETIWHPKLNSNPQYHYDGILDSMRKASHYLETIDGIGVSSAGIYQNNEVKVASLFMSVPETEFEPMVKNIYKNIAKELNAPIEVANDGDVTALSGALTYNKYPILGIAMGTSQAAGYIDSDKAIRGWLNELAFVPLDYHPNQDVDPWSKDIGTGVNYLSQDAVIRLAKIIGIEIDEKLSPAEKLSYMQEKLQQNDLKAKTVFENIGVYLGFAIAYYLDFYDFHDVLILGRVTSKKAGDIIKEQADAILKEYFNNEQITIHLPDEKLRRVGQSIASASLIKIIDKENNANE